MAENKLLKAVKNQAAKVADDRKKKKHEKELKKRERELAAAREEEERIRKEQEAVQAEKDRLMSMNQQELLAEAIMAIRGFYQEHLELKARQDELEESIAELEADIDELRRTEPADIDSAVDRLREDVDQLRYDVDMNNLT